MSRDPQLLADYLGHIVEAIGRIERYTADLDEVGFLHSEIVQDAVIRNFEIIGEASRNIERHHLGFAAAHPQVATGRGVRDAQRPGTRLLQGGLGTRLAHDQSGPATPSSTGALARGVIRGAWLGHARGRGMNGRLRAAMHCLDGSSVGTCSLGYGRQALSNYLC
jgi:hypothetical protein